MVTGSDFRPFRLAQDLEGGQRERLHLTIWEAHDQPEKGPKPVISFSPHYARATCCDRGSGGPSGRPRVSLVPTLSPSTLRRTDKHASGPSPAVPRDACPVARPSPRPRSGVSRKMRARTERFVACRRTAGSHEEGREERRKRLLSQVPSRWTEVFGSRRPVQTTRPRLRSNGPAEPLRTRGPRWREAKGTARVSTQQILLPVPRPPARS